MGRHRDPDTLEFINWLKVKGQSLGYIAELEYSFDNKEYFIDIVWKRKQDESPLITFEIETKDSRSIFCNAEKIFGTQTIKVPKPWKHYIIIYKGKLSKGHRESLSNKLNQHNIMLYDNIFGNLENKQKLEHELENLKYDVSEQIKNDIQNKSLSDTLSSVLKGLSEGLSGGLLGMPEISLTLKSANPPKLGIPGSITILTSKGEPTFLDKLNEASKTLKPFSIESPQLKDLTINGKSVFPKDTQKVVLTITPRPVPPVRIVVPGSQVAFDNIFLRLVKKEGTTDYLSTEERNLPFTFNFMIDRQNKANDKFDFEFKSTDANVKQALKFEELIRSLNNQKVIAIVNPQDEKPFLIFHVRETMEESEDLYYLLSKLAYIQDKTNHVIPVPTKINQDDIKDIFEIINVIDTGQEQGLLNEITLGLDKKNAKELVDIQLKQGKISGLQLSRPAAAKVFNEVIPFGKTTINLPDMQFSLPIKDVEEMVNSSVNGNPISLSIKPVSDNKIIIKFEDWQAKK